MGNDADQGKTKDIQKYTDKSCNLKTLKEKLKE